MAVSVAGKENCVHNLVSLVVDDLADMFPDTSPNQLMYEFAKSKTYALMCNLQSGLWREGPLYILIRYAREKGFTIPDIGGE